MKKQRIVLICALVVAMLSGQYASAQSAIDSTGFPGDGLSLQAVLDLFKNSESLEDFEKKLNQESNEVNNLDLNEDGKIDYIRVVDNMEKSSHAIVLQVPVNEKENQDVAVITLEKTGNEEATLQIIGDADVYGEETIVEPFEEEKQSGGKNGPRPAMESVYVIVNVWHWRPVRYVYHPTYVVYASPWGWYTYPTWWRPWRPRPYVYYYPRVAPYHVHYRPAYVNRCHNAHAVYAPRRTSSTIVHTRTTTYKNTRKTTTTTTTTQQQGRRPTTTNDPGRQQNTTGQPTREAAPSGRQPATTVQPTREAAPSGRQPATREAAPTAKPATSAMKMAGEVESTTKQATKSSSSREAAKPSSQPTNKKPAAEPAKKQSKKPQTNQSSKSSGAKKSQGTRTAPRRSQGRQ